MTSKTTRGFTGHEEDDEFGLVNMKGRIMDPRTDDSFPRDEPQKHARMNRPST
jgi:hypothetical protein